MPTYVYECNKCQKTFEVEQRIIEEPLKDCPCGAKGTLKRLIQPTAVLFKGSGFHINDYSGPGAVDATKDAGPKTDSPSEAPKRPTTEATSGSKPAPETPA